MLRPADNFSLPAAALKLCGSFCVGPLDGLLTPVLRRMTTGGQAGLAPATADPDSIEDLPVVVVPFLVDAIVFLPFIRVGRECSIEVPRFFGPVHPEILHKTPILLTG